MVINTSSVQNMSIDTMQQEIRSLVSMLHHEARVLADSGHGPKDYALDLRPVLQPFLATFRQLRFSAICAQETKKQLLLPMSHLYLPRVILRGLDLTLVNFEGCTLDDAQMDECFLCQTNLNKASCQRTNFTYAGFDQVRCRGTNFHNANWQGTAIVRTDFSEAQLLHFDETTLVPEKDCQDSIAFPITLVSSSDTTPLHSLTNITPISRSTQERHPLWSNYRHTSKKKKQEQQRLASLETEPMLPSVQQSFARYSSWQSITEMYMQQRAKKEANRSWLLSLWYRWRHEYRRRHYVSHTHAHR